MKKKILIISRSMPRASKLKKLLNRAGFNCMIINDMPSLEKVDRGHACTAIFMDFSFYVMGGLPFVKGL
ncbi:MAG: hypothetical protein PVH45_03685, partial [Candidatus Omnitrophota bacterium]